jgi:predicted phage baseplate assembly protein
MATKEGKISDLLHWLRFRIARDTYPASRAPEIDALVPNTVRARALRTVQDELVGIGNGQPDQKLRLRSTPVDPDSLVLRDSLGEQWKSVDDLAVTGRDDRAFVLDPGSGELSFGDGEHGLMPVAGLELIADYRSGGGAQGNVAAREIKTVLTPLSGIKSVVNRRPARGGKAGQTIAEFIKTAPTILRTRDRAVTAADYAVLAGRFGQVDKAIALPQVHPGYPDLDVPGSVTVVIVPDGTDRRPEPTADLIHAVLEFLAPRRVLGTELHVTGPSFKEISVDAKLSIEPQASFARVLDDAKKALDCYLNAHTWRFGEDLDPTRLYGVLLNIEGVKGVPALAIRVDRLPHEPLQKAVSLPADGLVCPGTHNLIPEPSRDS